MSDQVLYLDSSAIVKVVLPERESAALARFLPAWPLRASSALARVEVMRAVRRLAHAPNDLRRVEDVLQRLTLLSIDAAILEAASKLEPPLLRTLDAIHLASAAALGSNLGGFVAYDARMAEAALRMGLRVFSPGADGTER
ncbi:MAG TPA: type II toxin-antitoxin system VapC family toxin [Chloroflexota bacterium]|nr:type II toxin-antitoxin system VapC family toxin [Chloroflexota bacterium]